RQRPRIRQRRRAHRRRREKIDRTGTDLTAREDAGRRPGVLVVSGIHSVASRNGHVRQSLDLTLGRRGGGGSMSNPLTHVATRRAGVLAGAPARGTGLGTRRLLGGRG